MDENGAASYKDVQEPIYKNSKRHSSKLDSGQDYKEAIDLWEKATKQGDIISHHNLAYLYDKGEGVKQDFQEAAKWRKKAASINAETES